MDLPGWLQGTLAVLAAIGGPQLLTAITERSSRAARLSRAVKDDIELHAAISWESEQKGQLRTSIETRVGQLAEVRGRRVDWSGLGVGAGMFVSGVSVAILGFSGKFSSLFWQAFVVGVGSLTVGASIAVGVAALAGRRRTAT